MGLSGVISYSFVSSVCPSAVYYVVSSDFRFSSELMGSRAIGEFCGASVDLWFYWL